MTQKDYRALVSSFGVALRRADSDERQRGVFDVMDRLTMQLQLNDPRFQATRFRRAVDTAADGK